MKRYKIYFLLFFISIAGCIFSCKKKDGAIPFSNVKIAAIDYSHAGEIQRYRVVYDQHNNVDSIIRVGDGTASGNSGYKAFIYFGSSYSITDETGNSFIVNANTNGMILKILTSDTLIMYYKGNQLAELDTKIAQVMYPYFTITSAYYNWTNGDLISFGPAGSTVNSQAYYYDLSKNGQPGDVLRINDFIAYGRSYIRTTHLATGLVNAADTTETCSYQFDELGRINRLVKKDNTGGVYDSTVYNYRYY